MGEKARRVHVNFMGLEKVNWEFLWQVLRIYDVSGKFLSRIKIMYVNSLGCVRVKGVTPRV